MEPDFLLQKPPTANKIYTIKGYLSMNFAD